MKGQCSISCADIEIIFLAVNKLYLPDNKEITCWRLRMGQNNKGKSDVLGNLLQGSHPRGAIPGLDELTMLLERYSRPLIKQEKVPPSPHSPALQSKSKKNKSSGKTKSTHYLTREVFKELDMANNFLRGLLPVGSKLLATKSNIVNYAVKMLLDDFDSKREESELVKKVLKDNPKQSR
jgi:hypothetical protein